MLIFFIWVGLSIVVGVLGSERKLGGLAGFLISLFLSPLIGLIAVLASDRGGNSHAISKRSNVEDFNQRVQQSKLEEFKGNKEKAVDLIKEALFFAEEEQKLTKKFDYRYNSIEKEKEGLKQRLKKLEGERKLSL